MSLWLAASLVLAGCSLTKLAYDHLGWLAHHYVSGFVDLTPAQGRDFDTAFAALWQWHRHTQLPAYSAFVRELSDSAGTVQGAVDVAAQAKRADDLGLALAQRVIHDAAPLIAKLSDAQVEQLLGEIDRRIAKSAKRASRLDDEDWRREQVKKTVNILEKYAGDLEPAQQQRIRDWASALQRSPSENHVAAQAWRDQFAMLLQQRQSRDFGTQLQGLLDPQAPALIAARQRRDAEEQRYIALLAELSSSCSPKQRQHLHESLGALATDLTTLAAEPDSIP